jgi:hypothetical protein
VEVLVDVVLVGYVVVEAAAVAAEEADRDRILRIFWPVEASSAMAVSSLLPTRSALPSNVTRAFSLVQVRFAALKRARITLSKSGMEKFACASVINRGMALPSVTLEYPGEKLVIVQPVKLATVQVGPVKPFVQMHAQAPLSNIEVPPFWHAVAVTDEQVARVDAVVVEEVLGLWNTKSSRGTTTAAAIITRRIRRTRRNPQTGRPQQRRRLGGCWRGVDPKSRASSYAVGHAEVGRFGVPPRVGVPKPGGGKAESMPERPD